MDIQLHRAQSEIMYDLFGPNPDYKMRFEVVVGSRGLGKSYTSMAAVGLAAMELEALPPEVPNKEISIICGTHQQVHDIYKPLLGEVLGLDYMATQALSSPLRWKLPNNTLITCRSAEAVARLRGTGQYLVVLDELPTWDVPGMTHEAAWSSVISPCITTRWSPKRAQSLGAPSPGRALIIASPLYKDFFYELSQRHLEDDRWTTRSYTYLDSPLLDSEEIEKERRTMDKMMFAREYLASFEDAGARVFYAFQREVNVRNDLAPFEPNEAVHCSIDFNVMKNCTAFHAIRGNQIHTLGELEGSANTDELVKAIKQRYPGKKIVCYPDPTGRARKTSAPIGQTDFSILRSAGFEVLARSSSPSIVDSVNAVNRLFQNAAGETNWFVSSECRGVIRSLESTVWVENRPDSALIDKTQNIEHFSDGFRYLGEYLFPVSANNRRVQTGFNF